MLSQILDCVKKIKNRKFESQMRKLSNIPWQIMLKMRNMRNTLDLSDIKVLIVNNPCMGFGDLVFAMKLSKYLREWYRCEVKIATTQLNGFKQLGEDENNLYLLKNKVKVKENKRTSQCRRNKLLEIDSPHVYKFDLIFVAPLTADFKPDYADIRSIIPYSNRFNTFYFSEYNDTLQKDIDFHTGIGDGRYGLLLNGIKNGKRLENLGHKYAVIYISDSINDADKCFLSFMEMVSKKYSMIRGIKYFEIITPNWISKKLYHKKILKLLDKYYDNIKITGKDEVKYLKGGKNKGYTLNIRTDIYPLVNSDMIRLIKYSVDDILLTGDQSITDAISCCYKKNIFYQIAPWKQNFGKYLAKNLPNKYLEKKITSCGTIKAIKYKSDYYKFKEHWDFRKLARPKMNAIFKFTKLLRENSEDSNILREYVNIVLNSRKVETVIRKLEKLKEIEKIEKIEK